ncbi:hypothetical protein Sjap_021946 [Stephania japonica]|uniref:UDENN domain-containing protein n=1 Tax=Stephania japonica TaxID=461633 RepID=A0AAP0HSA5_9MAGN
MLNSIVTQVRLNRITKFVTESAHPNYGPASPMAQNQFAGAGFKSEDEVSSFPLKSSESHCPRSLCMAEVSEFNQAKIQSSNPKNLHQFDDFQSQTSKIRGVSLGGNNTDFENCHSSQDLGFLSPRSSTLEHLASSESLFSSVRSMALEGEKYDKNVGNDLLMKWAKENNNDLLQLVCGYEALPLPSRGSEISFHPLEHLQAIKYNRPAVPALGLCESFPEMKMQSSLETPEVNIRLAAAEQALSLSLWTVATVCRVLSLESIMAFFAGVLLEKQVVVVSANLGVLSATVLSLIPMIRPFEWQSLLLPILPRQMFDFLDAPVPFIVGIQQKPADMKLKTSNLIYVNLDKDQVTMCYLPPLPRYKELISELGPIHARLSCENSTAKRHPVYKCNEVQAKAAGKFLQVMGCYMESLCSDLRSHSITNVQSNNDKVALLLKDSFIDSFPCQDRLFMKLLVNTQLFSVLSDSQLSS